MTGSKAGPIKLNAWHWQHEQQSFHYSTIFQNDQKYEPEYLGWSMTLTMTTLLLKLMNLLMLPWPCSCYHYIAHAATTVIVIFIMLPWHLSHNSIPWVAAQARWLPRMLKIARLQDHIPVVAELHRFILCTRRSGDTAHEGGGCDQSIGSTVSVAIVRSWLWWTATRSSPLGYFSNYCK